MNRGARRARPRRGLGKKLVGAARHWAEGGAEIYPVWPEHHATIEAWLTVCDQWRVLEYSGQALGLDWPAVKVLLNAAGLTLDAALLAGLRAMEREVVRVWWGRRESAGLV